MCMSSDDQGCMVCHKDTVTNLTCTSLIVMHKRDTRSFAVLHNIAHYGSSERRAEPIRSLNSRANVIDDPDVN